EGCEHGVYDRDDVGRARDAQDDDVTRARDGGRVAAVDRAELQGRVDGASAAGRDGDGVTGLEQVAGHRQTHRAEPDETDPQRRHRVTFPAGPEARSPLSAALAGSPLSAALASHACTGS